MTDIRASQIALVGATSAPSNINVSQIALVGATSAPSDIIVSQLAVYAACWEPPVPKRLVPMRLPQYIFKGKGRYIRR